LKIKKASHIGNVIIFVTSFIIFGYCIFLCMEKLANKQIIAIMMISFGNCIIFGGNLTLKMVERAYIIDGL